MNATKTRRLFISLSHSFSFSYTTAITCLFCNIKICWQTSTKLLLQCGNRRRWCILSGSQPTEYRFGRVALCVHFNSFCLCCFTKCQNLQQSVEIMPKFYHSFHLVWKKGRLYSHIKACDHSCSCRHDVATHDSGRHLTTVRIVAWCGERLSNLNFQIYFVFMEDYIFKFVLCSLCIYKVWKCIE